MNVYLITEDGVSFCIRAICMQEAIKETEQAYMKEIFEIRKREHNEFEAEEELEYYHREILQSCSLIGELKN